jgi:uncharacterized protein YdiU (UPF0061 family)
MNLTGESFDYGPYRFLPHSDPNYVAAYFDQTGLYSFGRQPEAVFWNLQQLAGCLTLVTDSDALVGALNGFAPAYRAELAGAMLARLGVGSVGEAEDAALAQAAFRALAEGGERLRWEPFFFDWFCGDAPRAMSGPRGAIYSEPAFGEFRARLADHAPVRPGRLDAKVFAHPDPEELLYNEIEALWAPIAEADDWSPFQAKLARIEAARLAWKLDGVD